MAAYFTEDDIFLVEKYLASKWQLTAFKQHLVP